MIGRLRLWFDRLMALGAGLCCALCFGVVLASSVSRYALNAPFLWSEELARYAIIYGTMFGSVLAYDRARHMRFALIEAIGGGLGRLLPAIADGAALLTGAVLVYSGCLLVAQRGGIESSGLGIAMAYPQAAIAIGGACLILAALLDLASRRAPRRTGLDPL